MRILPAILLLAAIPCSAATKSSKHPLHKSVKTTKAAVQETPGMAPERATEIQTALIKQGYLTGEPTGRWDTDSQAAMQKLQGDHGWQTKITPDSRALIQLGLGPKSSE